MCAPRQHACGCSGTLGSSSVRFLLLRDALWPSCLRLWSPLIAFCRCPILSDDLRKNWTFSARSQACPIARLSPPLSPRRPKSPPATLCTAAVVPGRACGRRGFAPAPRLPICVRWGGDSYFGLSWGRALLVYRRHLGGMCCGVMHVTCPGLMHVQRPGRRIVMCSKERTPQI